MPITLNGDNGITNVNGTAAAPAITGTDTDSGMYFDTNSVALSTAGTAALTVNSSQVVTLANALPAASGGTGLTSPGTSGNILTSNGTAWTSAAPSGGVTSLNGQTGAITNTDLYAIGSYIIGGPLNLTNYAVNATIAGSSLHSTSAGAVYTSGSVFNWANGNTLTNGSTLVNTGTWRCVSPLGTSTSLRPNGLWVRIS